MSLSKTIVLFEHGILSGDFAWAWVLPRLPRNVVPVVVDRNGRSTFDLALRRLDYRAVLGRLLSLSPGLQETSRIVLVGHSIGGLLIRAHANALGSRVCGMVYVDASSPDQFNPAADTEFQFIRLQQLLLGRTIQTIFSRRAREADVASVRPLPEGVQRRATDLLADRRFWLNAYRESRAVGFSWLDAALFPTDEHRPTAIVSSSVSADPESIQNLFEERLLSRTRPSIRFTAREATHESVLYDEEHSRAVNTAIEWVLDHAGKGER